MCRPTRPLASVALAVGAGLLAVVVGPAPAGAATPPAGASIEIAPSTLAPLDVTYGIPTLTGRRIAARTSNGEGAQWTASIPPDDPTGLALVPTTGAGPTFTTGLSGLPLGDVGTYDVPVDASAYVATSGRDGYTLHGATSVRVVVHPRPTTVSFAGPTTVDPGAASSATVELRARLARVPTGVFEFGDLRTVRVDVVEGTTTLCAAVAPTADGSVDCEATLARGTHAIAFAVGGNFVGAGSGAVVVAAPPPSDPPVPTTVTAPAPAPVTTTVATPAPAPVTVTVPAPPPIASAPVTPATTGTTAAPAAPAMAPLPASPLVRLTLGRFRLAGTHVPVTVVCPGGAAACSGVLRLRRGDRVVAARAYALAAGATGRTRVPVSPALRAAARRGDGVVLLVTATTSTAGSAPTRVVRAGRLRGPR